MKTSHQITFHPASVSDLTQPTVHHDALGSPTSTQKDTNDKSLSASLFSTQTNKPMIEDHNLIDAAVFYSISSTQKGLNGIDLGNQLIKQVASVLKAEFPTMNQFSSLSPIPNFTEYLLSSIQAIQRNDDKNGFLEIWRKHCDLKLIRKIVGFDHDNDYDDDFWTKIKQILRLGEWISDPILVEQLEKPLMRICAHYLYCEKRRGFALNAVGESNSMSLCFQ